MGTAGGIAHPRRRFQGVAFSQRHITWHPQVIGVTAVGVDVPGQRTRAAFQYQAPGAFRRGPAHARFGAAAEAGHRRPRNAVVDAVDDPTGGVAAIQQRSRAAQHFQPFGHQRVGAHRVVEAEVGRVGGHTAVVEQANAVAVQAADDGPAAVRAEPGAAHTGQAVERFAQRAAAAQHQAVTGQHAGGLGHAGAAQGVAGDDHRAGGLGLHGGAGCQGAGGKCENGKLEVRHGLRSGRRTTARGVTAAGVARK